MKIQTHPPEVFMKRFNLKHIPLFLTVLFIIGCSTKQATKTDVLSYIDLEAIEAGPFDAGKMWTFDFPPTDYFAKTYNFNPTKEWFDKARLAALRFGNGCSASFVSEDGLVMTNHHCARNSLDTVTRANERLAEVGFYAQTLDEERKVPNLFIDQLIIMEDVTAEVQNAFNTGTTDSAKVANRMVKIQEIQKRNITNYKSIAPQDSMEFKVNSFYNGGRFSLYGYKRYTDVRLVYAPEEVMAFFGGDPDNFTYPRYDFDCAFFRIYDNGKPLKTANFFQFSKSGAKEGDVVFVIGNPGKTSRLQTISQLEFLRDNIYPTNAELNDKIRNIYTAHVEKHPEAKLKYISTIFGLANSLKSNQGVLTGLRDPIIMAKKQNFEDKFRSAVVNNPELQTKYSDPWKDIAYYQAELTAIYPEQNALNLRGRYKSQYLLLAADLVDMAYQLSGPEEKIPLRLKGSMLEATEATFYPSNLVPEIEQQLLAFRLTVMKKAFIGKNKALNKLLNERTPEQVAEDITTNGIIASREKTNTLLAGAPEDILKSNDPLIAFMVAIRERISEIQKKYNDINSKLQASIQILGKAMYDVYGTQLSPEATFSLRITDGVVKGYEYNGTVAPPITTFYGAYDRYYSFGTKDPWKLPERWLNPPVTFKMNTPNNFVSTNDIVGGNSGSVVVNKDLQVVGLIFDGNIESLPGYIIYDDARNRAVSVHSAGLLEGLEQIYKTDRIAKELRSGRISQ
jgi:hypothetical protein